MMKIIHSNECVFLSLQGGQNRASLTATLVVQVEKSVRCVCVCVCVCLYVSVWTTTVAKMTSNLGVGHSGSLPLSVSVL